jgi:hypothetical protein
LEKNLNRVYVILTQIDLSRFGEVVSLLLEIIDLINRKATELDLNLPDSQDEMRQVIDTLITQSQDQWDEKQIKKTPFFRVRQMLWMTVWDCLSLLSFRFGVSNHLTKKTGQVLFGLFSLLFTFRLAIFPLSASVIVSLRRVRSDCSFPLAGRTDSLLTDRSAALPIRPRRIGKERYYGS